jgi:hypothetical protein
MIGEFQVVRFCGGNVVRLHSINGDHDDLE